MAVHRSAILNVQVFHIDNDFNRQLQGIGEMKCPSK